ncbi:MAG: DUF1440 domain-containing protein [Acidobacteriales bacterium]|nr:DUF1440 domain-containing protein [Terriglobales bacterium]
MFLKKMLLNKALKGVAAGMIGGLAASLVMNLFQSGVQAATDKLDPMAEAKESQAQGLQTDEDATMKMAGRISENLFDHPLDRDQRAKLGPVVHYTFGAVMGGLYGLTSEFIGGARAGFGAGFGTVLFLAADEVGVPVMGLSGPPSQTPPKQHAMALASHIVYGVTTELVRKTARPLL